jgi:putative transposase
MPRKRRFFLADVPVHVVQRGNNRQAIFFEENDYRVYLDWLAEAAAAHGCAIHAYVLMTNHIHLLMTPADGQAISATLQAIGRRFVPYINHCYGRTGTLWEGRFRASPVQEEGYLLVCYRYIELNPVRAGMVELPAAYPWSSYRANGLGNHSPLVSPHAAYLALGANGPERQAAYRGLFAAHIDPEMLNGVRACLQTGTPLGNDRFRLQIEQALGVKVGYSTRGRPKSPPTAPGQDASQIDLDLDKGI